MQYRPLQQTDIAPLAVFRIAFGLMMTLGTLRFMLLGWIEEHYTTPLFHFHYYGFEFIEPLNLAGMYIVHALMFAGALGIMLGAFYRWSALTFFLTFTYTELIDLTYYLNHYYFVSIVALVMVFLPAHRCCSIDVKRNPSIAVDTVPRWCIDVIKLQTAVVYTYAGIAKINYEWLIEALPLRIWLPAQDTLPLLGKIMPYQATAYAFSWIGMLYDCTIVWWLMNSKTRPWAYVSVIIFHVLTGMMFQIGIFPLVMITTTLIFFSNGFHRKLLHFFDKKITPICAYKKALSYAQQKSRLAIAALAAHFTFQIIFPWRFMLYPGKLFWTEQGYRFSWRVMLMEKAGTATFYVQDARTGKEGIVVNSEFLNQHQEKQMAFQPDMILQYAHQLKAWYESKNIPVKKIRAEVYVTLNGSRSRLYIDPNADLTQLHDNWQNKNWILPFEK
ncbi:MAG: HTTM domain-containing protein [Bacteroidia bacterium]|nr:HTTM domain-containing protein [Bacteroidia bacterium]MBP7261502.1 HTTM domain-containing protein [Bacteroidia bacterium]